MKLRRRRRGGIALAADSSRKTVLRSMFMVLAMAMLVIVMAISGPSPAVSAEGVALGYEGYLGGLHMLTAEVELARNETAYRMETHAKGRGLVGWFFNWTSNAVTEGVVETNGALRPRWHERDIAQRGRKPKAIQIEYRDDGVPLVARMRVGDEANFQEVAERRGTMDPMSAVTAIVDQMAAGASCKGRFPVFDGKLRYDVTAKMGDAGKLNGNKYMMYRGAAARCDLVLKAIDGFDDDEPKGNPRESGSPDDDTLTLTMWFASPAEGLPSVPVLASAKTDYGGLRIYLARAETAVVPAGGQRAEAR
ncbi:MAG: DUF3108 domain-containing protein [Alphaproteobacteria bacterium]|nr:DUF3108 domain-containing protein [Alphaproteobacteria bacterium]